MKFDYDLTMPGMLQHLENLEAKEKGKIKPLPYDAKEAYLHEVGGEVHSDAWVNKNLGKHKGGRFDRDLTLQGLMERGNS